MRRTVTSLLVGSVAALLVTGCAAQAEASPGREYTALITEPSGNIGDGDGKLFGHWSCDAAADPATAYQGGQDGLWTDVDGPAGRGQLQFQATCPRGAFLTVHVDAAALAVHPTRLRCEVFDAGGQRVAEEMVTRGLGTKDPVCRVAVPK